MMYDTTNKKRLFKKCYKKLIEIIELVTSKMIFVHNYHHCSTT